MMHRRWHSLLLPLPSPPAPSINTGNFQNQLPATYRTASKTRHIPSTPIPSTTQRRRLMCSPRLPHPPLRPLPRPLPARRRRSPRRAQPKSPPQPQRRARPRSARLGRRALGIRRPHRTRLSTPTLNKPHHADRPPGSTRLDGHDPATPPLPPSPHPTHPFTHNQSRAQKQQQQQKLYRPHHPQPHPLLGLHGPRRPQNGHQPLRPREPGLRRPFRAENHVLPCPACY